MDGLVMAGEPVVAGELVVASELARAGLRSSPKTRHRGIPDTAH